MKQAFKLLTNLAVADAAKVCDDPSLGGLVAAYLRADAPPELRDAALQLLVAALPRSPALQASAGEAGCVAALVQLVSEVTFAGAPSALAPFSTFTVATTAALKVPSGLDAKGMQAAVLCLGLLATDAPANQQRFGDAGGVSCLLPLLKPRTDPALLHAAIECVWSAVAPCAPNVRRLVERDGVLQLLDILEAAPFSPRAHLLSCLADVMGEPSALEQAREWHGTKRQSAAQLCLALWQEESARRGGATGNGLVASTVRPLTTTAAADAYTDLNASLHIDVADAQPDEAAAAAIGGGGDGITPASLRLKSNAALQIDGRLGTHAGSTAALHTASLEKVDVRAKLYAVLSCLDFESDLPYTSEEALQLVAAKGYVPFATAEEWADARDEFAAEGLVPLDADRALLEAKLRSNEEAVAAIAEEQQDLIGEMAIADSAVDDANLHRVRVLRDGPMGQVKKSATRGSSSSARASRPRPRSGRWSPTRRSASAARCRATRSTPTRRSSRRRRRCSRRGTTRR